MSKLLDANSGKEIVNALDARMIDIAKEAYNNAPYNRTKFGKVISRVNGIFSVKIENVVYDNVIAIRTVGDISAGENVIVLMPNNNMSNATIIGVADGTIQSGGSGSGTVTSVTVAGGTGLSASGNPITTSGTITVNHTNSVVPQISQAIYPVTIDAQGHISSYGTAVTIPTNYVTTDTTQSITGVKTFSTNPIISGITNSSHTLSVPTLSANETIALVSQIPSLTGYVPYTGATTNLNLGTHNLYTTGSIGAGTTAPLTRISVVGNGTTETEFTAFTSTEQQKSQTISVEGLGSAWYVARDNTNGTEFACGTSLASGNPAFIGSLTAHSLELRTSNVARLTIGSTGAITTNSNPLTTGALNVNVTGTTSAGASNININDGTYNNAFTITNTATDGYSRMKYVGTGITYTTGVGNSSAVITEARNNWYLYDITNAKMKMLVSATDTKLLDNNVTIEKDLILSGSLKKGSYTYTLPSATGTFALTSQLFSGVYTDLTSKPILNSTSATALSTNASETITGTISLHKISKTGTFSDLVSKPTTLNGYGITDAYTETEINSLLTRKAVQPYIARNYSGGNGIRLIGTYNYSTSVGDTRPLFYMVGKQGHGNGTSYLWQGEFIFGVSTTGTVTAKAILKVSDGTYGKFYYRHDTANKILYLYIFTGQYSSAYFSDLVQINAGDYSSYFTLVSAGSVTSDTVVEGVNILYPSSSGNIALTSQLPTITLNGSVTTTPNIYAPTSAGNSGQILLSNGSGTAPSFQDSQILPPNTRSFWDGSSTAIPLLQNDGLANSSSNPYLIDNAKKLAYLSANPIWGNGKYFKQTVDIDLDNYPWTPINNTQNAYDYEYRGDNHSIYNLNVILSNTGIQYGGLFGFVSNGVINGLILDGGSISVTASDNKVYIGSVVGRNSAGYISNCSSNLSISGFSTSDAYIGGIVGLSQSDYIISNSFIGYLNLQYGTYTGFAGGIVGEGFSSTIINCQARTYLTSYSTVTSFGGYLIGSNNSSTITGCLGEGSIEADTINTSGNKANVDGSNLTPSIFLGGLGISSSVAELNYTDGVTSAIQTQLNNKANTNASNITASSWISALLTGVTGYGDKITAQSLSSNGYIKYVSGLTFQWGRQALTTGANTARTYSFPTTFNHTCLSCIAIYSSNADLGSGFDNTINMRSFTDGTFTFSQNFRESGKYIYWFAVGY